MNKNESEEGYNIGVGSKSKEIFSGKTLSLTTQQVYGESTDLFASTILEKINPTNECALIDLGGSRGELVQNIVSKLPQYNFNITVVDVDEQALAHNTVAAHKINSSVSNIPTTNKFDVTICRYVLAWNPLDRQRKIVQEIKRLTRGIAIIQHCGSDNAYPTIWRSNFDQIFKNLEIPELNRHVYFYSSQSEVESIFDQEGVKFERIQNRKIENLSNVFIERYELNEYKADLLRKIMENCNYAHQTTWLLDFRNS